MLFLVRKRLREREIGCQKDYRVFLIKKRRIVDHLSSRLSSRHALNGSTQRWLAFVDIPHTTSHLPYQFLEAREHETHSRERESFREKRKSSHKTLVFPCLTREKKGRHEKGVDSLVLCFHYMRPKTMMMMRTMMMMMLTCLYV